MRTFSEIHREALAEADAVAKRAEEEYLRMTGKKSKDLESDADARFRLAFAHGYLTSSLANAFLRIKEMEAKQS